MTSVVASADRYSVWVERKDVVIMSKPFIEDEIYPLTTKEMVGDNDAN